MAAMRRLAALLSLALATAACGGEDLSLPSGSPVPAGPSGTASPTPVLSPTPTPSPAALRLPEDAPTTFGDPLAPGDVPLADLLPPGAQIARTWFLAPPTEQLALIGLAWGRGEDPFAREQGFVVWMRFEEGPAWRAVYAFTDPAAEGVFGIRLQTGDLTGDSIDDALTFEDTGGSGACGTWRVISPTSAGASQVFRRRTCDTEIAIEGGVLRVREAVFDEGDAHCCPSAFRITRFLWDGSAFRRGESELMETP